jgi:MFS family permease
VAYSSLARFFRSNRTIRSRLPLWWVTPGACCSTAPAKATSDPMQNVAPVINRAGRGRTLRLAFLSAAVSLAAAFGASAAPIPLFNTYRAEDGFTNADISLAVVAYDLPTLVALLVTGRLSNHLGRRPASIASLGLLVLGCLLLLNVHDVGTLLAGRVLMGLGAGLAGSNVTVRGRHGPGRAISGVWALPGTWGR